MRYLVQAQLKPEKAVDLLTAINNNTLGQASVAFGEYTRNLQQARVLDDGNAYWIENCFCGTPLAEERQYWEAYFVLGKITRAQQAHLCKDSNGEQHHACMSCNCTEELEQKLAAQGHSFMAMLKQMCPQT